MFKKLSKFQLIVATILSILLIFTFLQFSKNPNITNSKNSTQNLLNSQTKPLVADSEHDVVVLEECDLAIKIKNNYINKTKPPKIENSLGDWTNLWTKQKAAVLNFL